MNYVLTVLNPVFPDVVINVLFFIKEKKYCILKIFQNIIFYPFLPKLTNSISVEKYVSLNLAC